LLSTSLLGKENLKCLGPPRVMVACLLHMLEAPCFSPVWRGR